MSDAIQDRRPIKARSSAWARRLASLAARTGLSPDQISVLGVLLAALGAAIPLWFPTPVGFLASAVAIQGRLLANLLDGMVAIEGGKASPLGRLYNELPDRVSDVLLIVALGYVIHLPVLGWVGALAAVSTAYVRVFGGSLGLPQDFRGPMAKAHRMAVLTAGYVLGAIEQVSFGSRYALVTAAVVIAAGSLVTCLLRTRAITVRVRRAET